MVLLAAYTTLRVLARQTGDVWEHFQAELLVQFFYRVQAIHDFLLVNIVNIPESRNEDYTVGDYDDEYDSVTQRSEERCF